MIYGIGKGCESEAREEYLVLALSQDSAQEQMDFYTPLRDARKYNFKNMQRRNGRYIFYISK